MMWLHVGLKFEEIALGVASEVEAEWRKRRRGRGGTSLYRWARSARAAE